MTLIRRLPSSTCLTLIATVLSTGVAFADCEVRFNFGPLQGLDAHLEDHHPNSSSCFESGDTRFFTFYQFAGSPGRTVSVQLTSQGFGPFVFLENANTLQVIGTEFESSPGTITLTRTVQTSDPYWIVITSYEDFGGGDFGIHVFEGVAPTVTPTRSRTPTPGGCVRCRTPTPQPTRARGRPTLDPAVTRTPTPTRGPVSSEPVARGPVLSYRPPHIATPVGTKVRGRRTPTPTP
jgi:hypothetical protein